LPCCGLPLSSWLCSGICIVTSCDAMQGSVPAAVLLNHEETDLRNHLPFLLGYESEDSFPNLHSRASLMK